MAKNDKSDEGRMQRARDAAAEQSAVIVGRRVKRLRKYLKAHGATWHTQQHLADLAGIHQSQMSAYEKGHSMLPPEVALVLCYAFVHDHGIQLEWLYRGVDTDLRRSLREWLSKSH